MQQMTQAQPDNASSSISIAGFRPNVVAFVEAGTADGGSTSWLLSTLKYLDRSRFDPLVIFYYPAGGATVEKIRALGVPMLFASSHPPGHFPGWLRHTPRFWPLRKLTSIFRLFYRFVVRDTSIIRRVRSMLQTSRAAAVVLNADLHFHYCGAIAAQMVHLPVLCRKSGGIGEGKRIKKLLTRFIDIFVPISKAAERDQFTSPDTRRTVLIYEGVDMSEYNGRPPNPRLRQALEIAENKKVVTSVARLEIGKGQTELIEAAARVIQEFPNCTFLIVGEETPPNGPITASLHESVRRLGLKDHVIFAGARGDVPDILAITDIFVHCPTTWIEGLGICHLEAMASGKPSLISANGGLPEAAVDGVTGIVVPPGDIAAMSSALLRLLRDPALSERLGRAARERAKRLFDIAANNTAYESLLDELVINHSGANA
jgi:glycosyltransferase involved in cell wall biosynthesis